MPQGRSFAGRCSEPDEGKDLGHLKETGIRSP